MIRVKKRGTTPGAHLQNMQGSEGEGGAADYFCNVWMIYHLILVMR